MTTPADDFVLQLAREKGLLRDEQIDAARATIARHALNGAEPPALRDVLIAMGALNAKAIAALLADEFHVPLVALDEFVIPAEVVALVPKSFAQSHPLIPFKLEGKVLHVAISDPLELDGVDSLSHLLELTIETALAPAEEIHRAIERAYAPKESAAPAVASQAEIVVRAVETRFDEFPDTREQNLDTPVINYVTLLIREAVRRRASDIHVEPLEKRLRVRYRIDGVLLEVENPPKRLQLAIVSRLKLMADISIAEKRIPQDGRIQITLGERSLDLRVSSLPTSYGESIVMRILDKTSLQLGLPELGFLPDDQAKFERVLTLPDGIVLVTGPTGSGKTTTLYSCLHFLNKPDRKIITVEDPVEYQLTGVNQVPVRQETGVTFASALRAMLRQAPNIVMIGEIRDLETAEIAINASLTGHLVFSTLHTNDAAGAVTRLIDLGVKPYLVSAACRAILAQRLVRKICRKCSRPCTPLDHEMRALNLDPAAVSAGAFARGAGCADCNQTGYRGRFGIFEMLRVDDEIQRLIYEQSTAAKLREAARRRGMSTMREDGARKVIAGLTTFEEVVSITVGDAS